MFGMLDCDHYSGALRSVLKADAKPEEATRLAMGGNTQDGAARADEREEGEGHGGGYTNAGGMEAQESGEAVRPYVLPTARPRVRSADACPLGWQLGLPREAVTESTIMQVMGVVEQAAYDTLHRYALFVANKSPSEALPVREARMVCPTRLLGRLTRCGAFPWVGTGALSATELRRAPGPRGCGHRPPRGAAGAAAAAGRPPRRYAGYYGEEVWAVGHAGPGRGG